MPLVIGDAGPIKLSIRYVHKRKSNGAYFYYQRIPRALKHHYPNAGLFIRRSLGTKDPTRAAERAIEHASRDDALWRRLAPLSRQEPIGSCALHPTGAARISPSASKIQRRLAPNP